jgi:hypothetical protein
MKISCTTKNDMTEHKNIVLVHTGEGESVASAQTSAFSCTDVPTSQDIVHTNACLAISPRIRADKRYISARRKCSRTICRVGMKRRQSRLQKHVKFGPAPRRKDMRSTARSHCSIFPKRASRPALRPVSDVLYRGRPRRFMISCPFSCALPTAIVHSLSPALCHAALVIVTGINDPERSCQSTFRI